MVDLANTAIGITKLTGQANYHIWQSCVKSYLEGQDLWEVIDGNDTEPPENDYRLRNWKVKAGKVMYVLKLTIQDELQVELIKEDDTPKMAWDTLASTFSKTNDAQLQYERDRESNMDAELYKAAKKGDVHCLPRTDGRSMTEEQAMSNELRKFLSRTQHGNNNILHIAASTEHCNFVAEVRDRFPFLCDQVNSQGETPLVVAARSGRLEIVKALMKNCSIPTGMPPARENQTDPSSSHPPSGVAEDGVDPPLEADNIPVGVPPASENQTDPSSNPPTGAEEDRVDNPLEAVNIPVVMPPASENQTEPSSSHHQRLKGKGIVNHQLEQDIRASSIVIDMKDEINSGDMPAAKEVQLVDRPLENQTDPSSSHHQRRKGKGIVDHQLEQGIIASMPPASENQTDPSSSHRPRHKEKGIIYRQLEQGIKAASMVTIMEDVRNSGDMPAASEESPVHLQLHRLIPDHWRVANWNGATRTTALHEALRNGHQDVALYLLGRVPAIAAFGNLAGESPLFLAAESRCESFMLEVLRPVGSYSTAGPHGLNVLHAARYCRGGTISKLIDQNPGLLRQRDNRGKAAIHYAVEADYGVLLDAMLEHDPSLALYPNDGGFAPLLTASSRGCWMMCKKILDRCPESIESRNYSGQNALHLYKSWNYREMDKFVEIPAIRELLNVGDNDGNTPLHLAIRQDDYDKAAFLISLDGIKLDAVNKRGLTALDLCESDGQNLQAEKLMRFHLRSENAPRGRRPFVLKVRKDGPNKVDFALNADLRSIVKTINLIAILIVTVTFAAAFTMPGGFKNGDPDPGLATLTKKTALKVFIVSDTVAMCSSITVVFLLMWAASAEGDVLLSLVNASWLLLCFSLIATLVAFICGIYAVIAPKSLVVAVVVIVVCSLTPFLITPRTVVDLMFPNSWFFPITLTRDIPTKTWHRLKRIARNIIKKIKLRRNHGQRNEPAARNRDQPAARDQPDQPAAMDQPAARDQPDQPAAMDQPAARNSDQPAARNRDQPASRDQPDQPAAMDQPAARDQPDQPAAMDQPAARNSDQPAAMDQPAPRNRDQLEV